MEVDNLSPIDLVILVAESDMSFSASERKMLSELFWVLNERKAPLAVRELNRLPEVKSQLDLVGYIKKRSEEISSYVDKAEFDGNNTLRKELCLDILANFKEEQMLLWLGLAIYVSASDQGNDPLSKKMTSIENKFFSDLCSSINLFKGMAVNEVAKRSVEFIKGAVQKG